jgi:hypothetical protein
MRTFPVAVAGGVLLLGLSAAWAQSSNSTGTGASSTTTTNQAATIAPVNAQGEQQTQTDLKAATTTTTPSPADAEASMKAIRDRAKNASSKGRALVDKKLAKVSSDVDAEATANGKEVAAGRVAPEFGMTPEALVAECDQFSAGLGEVIIGHTLMANSTNPVTMEQLFAMRADGMGWGQIAQGLNLRLGEVVSAVTSEGRVAQGTMKADGKTAMIHSGSATRVSTNAGVGAGVKAGKTGVAGSVGVGAGTKVGK